MLDLINKFSRDATNKEFQHIAPAAFNKFVKPVHVPINVLQIQSTSDGNVVSNQPTHNRKPTWCMTDKWRGGEQLVNLTYGQIYDSERSKRTLQTLSDQNIMPLFTQPVVQQVENYYIYDIVIQLKMEMLAIVFSVTRAHFGHTIIDEIIVHQTSSLDVYYSCYLNIFKLSDQLPYATRSCTRLLELLCQVYPEQRINLLQILNELFIEHIQDQKKKEEEDMQVYSTSETQNTTQGSRNIELNKSIVILNLYYIALVDNSLLESGSMWGHEVSDWEQKQLAKQNMGELLERFADRDVEMLLNSPYYPIDMSQLVPPLYKSVFVNDMRVIDLFTPKLFEVLFKSNVESQQLSRIVFVLEAVLTNVIANKGTIFERYQTEQKEKTNLQSHDSEESESPSHIELYSVYIWLSSSKESQAEICVKDWIIRIIGFLTSEFSITVHISALHCLTYLIENEQDCVQEIITFILKCFNNQRIVREQFEIPSQKIDTGETKDQDQNADLKVHPSITSNMRPINTDQKYQQALSKAFVDLVVTLAKYELKCQQLFRSQKPQNENGIDLKSQSIRCVAHTLVAWVGMEQCCMSLKILIDIEKKGLIENASKYIEPIIKNSSTDIMKKLRDLLPLTSPQRARIALKITELFGPLEKKRKKEISQTGSKPNDKEESEYGLMSKPPRQTRFETTQPPSQFHIESFEGYFDEALDIQLESDPNSRVRAYRGGYGGALFVLIHGAGLSAMNWALLSRLIKDQVEVLAIDLRGHGFTETSDDSKQSLDQHAEDVIEVVNKLYSNESPHPVGIVLVGHSLGGSIVTRVAEMNKLQSSLRGLFILDVVESTAIESLFQMDGILNSRPKQFPNMSAACKWASQHLAHKPESLRISAPYLFRTIPAPDSDENEGKTVVVWRTQLAATRPYWQGWFKDLNARFLSPNFSTQQKESDQMKSKTGKPIPKQPIAYCPRVLIVADVDRLDKALQIAQMQGRFQFEVVGGGSGHHVMEENPEKIAQVIIKFAQRYGLNKESVGGAYALPAAQFAAVSNTFSAVTTFPKSQAVSFPSSLADAIGKGNERGCGQMKKEQELESSEDRSVFTIGEEEEEEEGS
ncbi:MAG: putative Protein phosphatase methylesterase 1 [Streblomastix strix]|uniref:protein phosphatase methylesterase-1 n=1 Tax=Streblomastix strix TaxID=222440 RepID=A0A5J4WYM8_9EUKA|nr:MAG: putative Protein phosphatase methylesterase 1 [Streblomastix strix]